MDKIQSLLKSKRFWLTAAGLAATLGLGDKLGLTSDQMTNLILAIGALVVGESLRPSDAKPAS